MDQHQAWLSATSRNVLTSKNRHRKTLSTFGDDAGNIVLSGAQSAASGAGQILSQVSTLSQASPSNIDSDPVSVLRQADTTPDNTPLNTSVTGGGPTLTGTLTDTTTQLTEAVVKAAGAAASATGSSGEALKQAVSLATSGASGPALAAAQAAQSPSAQAAFNTGIAIVNGASKVIAPQGASPAAKAGYLAAHGLQGATPAVKAAVATVLAATPATRAGLQAGIGTARKSWWLKLLEFFHLAK